MKNLKFIGFLIVIASSLLFIQCTTDTIVGPAGADGINGIDGINGVDGVDGIDGADGVGTASCVACHSETHRGPIDDSYAMSGHFDQTTMYNGSKLTDYTNQGFFGGSCTPCHSNEGYINYITGEPIATLDNPSVVGCTTCHDKHGTFDFENDGHDYALRNIEPIELIVGGTIDYEGTSNNCAFCHQPRKTPPTDDGTGIFNVPSHYGPHYGAQTTMLEGIEGAEIAGSVSYPAIASSKHRTNASCVSCHMGDANDNDGEHSMIPTLNACATCHGDAETLTTNLQTEVTDLMTTLEGLLIDNGILDSEGDLVTGNHPVAIANAYWNWEFVYQDHSKGVHNPAYTRALLKNAIESLQP